MKNKNKVLKAFDFIDKIQEQDDLDEAVKQFHKFVGDMGWSSFAMAELVNPANRAADMPLALNTWPDSWQKRWIEEGYILHDPVVLETLRRTLPFYWHDIRPHQSGLGARIMDEGGEFGFFDGLCIPVRKQQGPVTNITLAGEGEEASEEERLSLQLVCMYFLSTVENLMGKREEPKRPKLSPRERECLHWVSSGKSDWEIGQILNISQHTARFHVQKAVEKLNATTRTQAVALALRYGEIMP